MMNPRSRNAIRMYKSPMALGQQPFDAASFVRPMRLLKWIAAGTIAVVSAKMFPDKALTPFTLGATGALVMDFFTERQ